MVGGIMKGMVSMGAGRKSSRWRLYKIKCYIYLAGFALLLLLFVNGQITNLMQEHAELKDDICIIGEFGNVMQNKNFRVMFCK
jgi:hypothetical protein